MNGIPNSKRRTGVVKYLLLLVLVLVLAGAVVAYLLERSRVADLDQRNQQLQSEVQQLQNTANTGQPDAQPAQPTTYESQNGVTVAVYSPQSDETVASPLGIVGEVPGTWSFEASFPVQLRDGNGKVIAEEPAQIQGDWMTENDVPFAVTLTFDQPATATGTLVLQKANAAGTAENDDTVSIPVKFE